ncbi:hypothetical protein FRC06_011840 [Ceratobasidium sp. 370]|nr:hypothetical protein FRC06_011840 [Ceratobasidium sp. 370]
MPTTGSMGLARTPEAGDHHHPKTPRRSRKASQGHQKRLPNISPKRPMRCKSPSAKQPRQLAPSSIPFFRRSSSHSMQVQHSTGAYHGVPQAAVGQREGSMSPTFHPPPSLTHQASSHPVSSLASESGFSRSGFSGVSGPPSTGSSSRESVSGDKSDTGRSAEGRERKNEDKERSESHILALMGRKRGKTISSAEERRGSKTAALPPMRMSMLPASTVRRVANLKVTGTPTATRLTISSANRATSSPAITISKASDNLLRISRQHLPTIAGSPSVGLGGQQSCEAREGVSAMSNATITEDTPRSRRTSLNITGLGATQQAKAQVPSRDGSPSGQSSSTNEFGMMAAGDAPKPQYAMTGATARSSVRVSLPQSTSRAPPQSNAGASSSSPSATLRRSQIYFEHEKRENKQEQLSCILEVLGVPDKELMNCSSRKRLFLGTRKAAAMATILTRIV